MKKAICWKILPKCRSITVNYCSLIAVEKLKSLIKKINIYCKQLKVQSYYCNVIIDKVYHVPFHYHLVKNKHLIKNRGHKLYGWSKKARWVKSVKCVVLMGW